MAEVTHPRWAAALARRAGPINAEIRVAQAHGASTDALRTALRTVGGVYERLSDAAGAGWTGDDWAQRLATTTVYLVQRQQFGGKSLARWALVHVAPAFGAAVRSTTPQVLPDLVRAVLAIREQGDTYLFAQLLMSGIEAWPGITTAEVRKLGVVAAWRAGHVRLRRAALRLAADVPDAALGAALAVTDPRDVLARNSSDPNWWPGAATSGVLRTIGGFRGFGGPWLGLPAVLGGDGVVWHVRSDSVRWIVMADAHGATALVDPDPPDIVPSQPAPLRIPGTATAVQVGDVALVGKRDSYLLELHRLG